MKALAITMMTLLMVSSGTQAFAQMTSEQFPRFSMKPGVIRNPVALNLQTADMHIESAAGSFENTDSVKLTFGVDVKAKSEFFQATYTKEGKTATIRFAVVESTVNDCGVRTLIAAPAKFSENKYTLTVIETPAECSSGFVPEPVWAAQLIRSLGDTEMIDGHLEIFGTPAVLE